MYFFYFSLFHILWSVTVRRLHRNCCETVPQLLRNCTATAARLYRNLCGIALQSRSRCATTYAKLHCKICATTPHLSRQLQKSLCRKAFQHGGVFFMKMASCLYLKDFAPSDGRDERLSSIFAATGVHAVHSECPRHSLQAFRLFTPSV